MLVGFNTYNIYVLLYSAPTYSDSAIFPYLGHWVRDFVRLHVFFNVYSALVHYLVLYSYGAQYLHFHFGCFYLFVFLRFLIDYQSEINGVFNIMSCPNTIWMDVACNLVWYMLHTNKSVTYSISDHGSSLSR